MSVPYPALDLASSSDAIVFGASSSLHYFNPATSVSVSTPKNAPTTTYVAGSLLVRLVAISQDGRHAATISDDKSLRVYALPASSTSSDSDHETKLLSTRHLTKKASAISFTPSPANDLLISDKVGDIYLYPLEANAIPEGTERPLPNNLASDPSLNPDATFLAGHVSIVTSHIFTPDQKFLITADRDEHIRVSHYPNAYNIERFLFGSEGFVSAMHLVPASSSSTTSISSSSSSSAGTGSSSSSSSAQDLLISGGGESVLRVWDWRKGKQLKQIEIFDAVLPHRRVRSSFRRIKDSKKRAKIDTNDLRSGKDEFYTPPDGYILPSGQGVLIKKITSIEVGGKTVVLFFSEGCAALHSFVLPTELSEPVAIQTLPLPYPLIDFTTIPAQPTQLLLSLDTAFGVLSENPPPTRPAKKEFALSEEQLTEVKRSLRVVEVGSSGEFSDASNSSSTILEPLYSLMSRPENLTTPELLSTLPMYADLSLYPRWPGLEEDDDLAGPAPTDADADADAGNTGNGAGKAGKQARKADGTADGNDDTQIKIKKDYTREELEAMGVKQLGRLKAHGVDVADLLLIRKKNAKARGKEAKRRKLEEANANANAEGGGEGESKGATKTADKIQSSQVEEEKGGEEDMIANA